ncbi:MAG: hypothetical protein K2R98_02265 [Gemmataceae bacterium]|nr:hypothetical protein [Gemmataceae bacterium]
MARKLLFTVNSPLGYCVALTRNRWREIVRYKHPALAGRHGEVRHCVEDPSVIRASVKDSEVHLHYRTSDRGYLCVVVGADDSDQRFVITAYYTKDLKQGQELWTK